MNICSVVSRASYNAHFFIIVRRTFQYRYIFGLGHLKILIRNDLSMTSLLVVLIMIVPQNTIQENLMLLFFNLNAKSSFVMIININS